MNSSAPRPPKGTGTSGRRLWRYVCGEYVLEEHELVLLRQAVATVDLCDRLQEVVDRDGPMLGGRTHPAAIEARHQRIVLARLITALRVPIGLAQEVPQHRGTRGVHQLRPVQ